MNKKRVKGIKIFLLFVVISFLIPESKAQDNKQKNLTVSIDLVNRYVWRGLNYCSSPNIQPYVAYSTTNQKFSFGAWGSYSNNKNYGEVDLFASYTGKHLTISVWDYFLMDENIAKNHYFHYKSDSTKHACEASVVFGNFKIPLKITSSIFFYGNDKDASGNNYYSMYFEASYALKFDKNNLDIFIGGTSRKSLYGSGAGIVNLGCSITRNLKITDKFSIPIKSSLVLNPRAENIYFTIGITI